MEHIKFTDNIYVIFCGIGLFLNIIDKCSRIWNPARLFIETGGETAISFLPRYLFCITNANANTCIPFVTNHNYKWKN
jgi:hypothetical protein